MIDAFLKDAPRRSRREVMRSVGLVALAGGGAAVLGACSGEDPALSGDGSATGSASSAPASSGPASTDSASSEAPESDQVEEPDNDESDDAASDDAEADDSAPADAESDEPKDESDEDADLTIAKADVPEGGGVIDGDFVVTQPEAGDYKAFSSTCTHQGCPVSAITDGRIHCNCHGSEFSIADGSVVNGPADAPLSSAAVRVHGDKLSISA